MNPFLKGERVYLRQLNDADAGRSVQWFNDAEVCAGNSHHVRPYTLDDARAYIYDVTESDTDLVLAIVTKKTDIHIGNVALQNIHPVYRSADFSIIIGERDYWGKGYGKEAATLMFDHGFKAMNLHRIACGTFSTNTAMRKLTRSLGMSVEGLRIDAAYKNGEYLDVSEYGILRKDWLNR